MNDNKMEISEEMNSKFKKAFKEFKRKQLVYGFAPEILESLIELTKHIIDLQCQFCGSSKTTIEIVYSPYIKLIEKATGKKWEDIINE